MCFKDLASKLEIEFQSKEALLPYDEYILMKKDLEYARKWVEIDEETKGKKV